MFNPEQPRDERGRWALVAALQTAWKALNNNTSTSHHVALGYLKAASERAPANVKPHITAALNSKSYATARGHIRDALAVMSSGVSKETRRGNHAKHALNVHVAHEITHEVSKELKLKRRNLNNETHVRLANVPRYGNVATKLQMARGALPPGHPARTHLGRAMAAIPGTKSQVHTHVKRAIATLKQPQPLRPKVDKRAQRAAAARLLPKTPYP